MGIIEKLRNRHKTAYIAINSHKCVACWACYDICPKQVFGKIDFLGHRHIKIKDARKLVLVVRNASAFASITPFHH